MWGSHQPPRRPDGLPQSVILGAAASVSPLSSPKMHIYRSTLTCQGEFIGSTRFMHVLEFENHYLVHRGDYGRGRLGRKHPVFPQWAPAAHLPPHLCHWPHLDHPLLPSRAVLPCPSPISPSSPLED